MTIRARKKFAEADRKRIQEEAANLRKVHHYHIVSLIGTYEDQKNEPHGFCLLMGPVGNGHLGEFLDKVGDKELESEDRSRWTE